jgi:hypothetical protein
MKLRKESPKTTALRTPLTSRGVTSEREKSTLTDRDVRMRVEVTSAGTAEKTPPHT